ncbi:MAG TPA: hypothetical protein DCS06_03975 [Candidatus Yanofskybacteria bacterium]|nr:MAG: Protein containing Heat shock protein Hsp20 protein [Candidatus Yanofskybacteria bacterium GW2011_GWE1_40_10]OGN40617.1 MAG: hypothetical protein A2457_01940 [Candidatus Yanofskybacteria bacterium RIFOXYC2_FULL_44_13]HAU08107.1 hypothetical protein [Candidatus Yanofskybacteria bacterium]
MEDYLSENNLKADLVAKRITSPKKESRAEGQLTVDVYQTNEFIVIQSAVAGALLDDIDISVTNDMVTIRGKRLPEEDVDSRDYFHQELYWGPFSRSIILPVEVDPDRAKAAIKNGVLTVRLPRMDRAKTKKIKISD